MRRWLVLFLLIVPVVPIHARAAAGCEVFATGHPDMTGSCRYTAAGPGAYEAQSLSGFRISASSDGGTTWRTLVARDGNDPVSSIVVQSGTLATKAGDMVTVGVGIESYTTPQLDPPTLPPPGPPLPAVPQQTARYQDGHVKANDV